ncbi:MAG: DsbC family protein [Xanthomonadales bacterium]|nr:DsbC family protein [Xanthomonadales bacterium]
MNKFLAAVGLLLAASLPASADDKVVREAIQGLVPGASIDAIAESTLPGFYEVTLGGQVVYVTADGRYLVQGAVFDIVNRVDLTEQKRAGARREALAAVPADKRIVFAPSEVKHRLTVFTDIDCGYCRRLHQEMAEYNARGIAIEYLWFPRAGVGSESFQKAVNVWCAPDRRDAMTRAKAGQEVEQRTCPNPVGEDYTLGQQIGISGTPALITEDGTLLPGYMPADQLLMRLDGLKQAAAGTD